MVEETNEGPSHTVIVSFGSKMVLEKVDSRTSSEAFAAEKYQVCIKSTQILLFELTEAREQHVHLH